MILVYALCVCVCVRARARVRVCEGCISIYSNRVGDGWSMRIRYSPTPFQVLGMSVVSHSFSLPLLEPLSHR